MNVCRSIRQSFQFLYITPLSFVIQYDEVLQIKSKSSKRHLL